MTMWLFGRKQRLSKLTLKDVRYEEKRLEIRENQLIAKLDQSEQEREEIFHQGAKTRSLSRRRIYARRFSQLAQRSGLTERELMRVGKELLTVGRLRAILERRHLPGGAHVLEKLRDEDMIKLSAMLEDDRITEEMYVQKLDVTLGVVNDPAYEPSAMGQEGLEVLKTWEQMDEGELEFDAGLKQADAKEKPEAAGGACGKAEAEPDAGT
jgi:hypothetical protein